MSSLPNTFSNFIGGLPTDGSGSQFFSTINPLTGEESGRFVESNQTDIDLAVQSAASAQQGAWGKLSPTARGRLLMAWGELIAKHADSIAHMESLQNGKLLVEMLAQARAAKEWLIYYGGLADKIEGRVIPVERQTVFNYTLREPIGVVGVIVPWNSPTFITVMNCAPALAAGNTVVIKPSELTPASALELARLSVEAGLPPGVVNVVTGGRAAGEALVRHEGVAKIAFTGSEGGGRAIAAVAGERLATYSLELGGKSPNIVFADADLDKAVVGLLAGIFAAAGQTCIAGSRAYVHSDVYDQVAESLAERARGIRLGDPLLPETHMGPVASAMQLEKDESMVRTALRYGAEVLHGGERAIVQGFENGFFFKPTILHKLSKDNPIQREEVFGPVLSLMPFHDDDEVALMANDTRFGLAAGIWTNNLNRAHKFARRLQAGTIWINTYRAVAFNSPFGGYKASGIGRMNGIEAIDQFLQTKSVWCDLGDEVQDPFIMKV